MRIPPIYIITALLFCFLQPTIATRTKPKKSKVVLIVLDGIRTEEFFLGKRKYHKNKRIKWLKKKNRKYKRKRKKYAKKLRRKLRKLRKKQRKSRKKLMPFLWGDLAKRKNSLVLGDHFRKKSKKCLVDNNALVSMPAYANILAARVQRNVLDNSFRGILENPTILDTLIGRGLNPDKIAVFASWNHVRHIVSQKKNPGFYIETGFKKGKKRPRWKHARFDEDLIRSVFSYLKPANIDLDFLFVSFNDSDEWAHTGKYKKYLKSIKRQDFYIRSLIEHLEYQKRYRNKTTYIVTTDHGRGRGKNWSKHGRNKGSKFIWMLVNTPGKNNNRLLKKLRNKCSHTAIGKFIYQKLNRRKRSDPKVKKI